MDLRPAQLPILLLALGLAWPERHAGATEEKSWRYVLRSAEQPTPPWRRRCPRYPDRPWRGIARPTAWPPEPRPPDSLDVRRLAAALSQLCNGLSEEKAIRLARWVDEYAILFDVDPFVLGALVRQSRCRSKFVGKRGAIGLTQIVPEPHLPLIRGGTYHYHLRQGDQWQLHELDISRFDFTRRALLDAEASVHHAAALLSVYSKQCAQLDETVRSVRHRHFVSHFFWGDRVLGTLFEDEVLRARRRLLWYYGKAVSVPLSSFRGVELHSPLDGVPRVISSHYREPREPNRRHGGVDFFSSHGEPVRAVADGEVMFSGVSHPSRGPAPVKPGQSSDTPRRSMGRGGLFVIITHANGLSSGYFHLSRYKVARGDKVTGGQLIGYVGRTGIVDSDPHLHFELRLDDKRIDPEPHLKPLLVPAWKDRPRPPKRRGKPTARPSRPAATPERQIRGKELGAEGV